MFRDLPPCNDVGADASAMFSSGRGDRAPTIFGEGIVFQHRIEIFLHDCFLHIDALPRSCRGNEFGCKEPNTWCNQHGKHPASKGDDESCLGTIQVDGNHHPYREKHSNIKQGDEG